MLPFLMVVLSTQHQLRLNIKHSRQVLHKQPLIPILSHRDESGINIYNKPTSTDIMTEHGKRKTLNRNDLTDLLIDMRLNQGYSREGIKKFLMQEPYKYAEPTARQYVREAAKEFEQRAIVNFGEDLNEDIERHESDRFLAIQRGDFKLANEILDKICKLKGHYVQRLELNGDINHFFKLVIPDEDQIHESDDSENGGIIK